MLRKAIADIQAKYVRKDIPEMRAGDTVRVHTKIKEGDKERIQVFEGVVIAYRKGDPGQLDVHGPEGELRRGRRAHVPRPQPAHRQDRGDGPRRGPPLAPLLPARPAGQGRPPPPGGGRRAATAAAPPLRPTPAAPRPGARARSRATRHRRRARGGPVRRALAVASPHAGAGGNIASDVILLEFAAQGIRGVAPAGGRATLRPGYNVVAARRRRRCAACSRRSSTRTRRTPTRCRAPTGGPANAPVRAGLTLVGNDRITYRLVRDFAAGAQLHRFDAEKRSFALVSQDLAEIASVMQKTIGVPPPGRLGALLALSAADLPSKQGGARRARARRRRSAPRSRPSRRASGSRRSGSSSRRRRSPRSSSTSSTGCSRSSSSSRRR